MPRARAFFSGGEAGRRIGLMSTARRLMQYDALLARGRWRPLPGCPGRSVWRGDRGATVADLLGADVPVRVFLVETARDPVHVAALAGGGLISYRQPDGRFVHTLNTPEGFTRKLRDLGIDPDDAGT